MIPAEHEEQEELIEDVQQSQRTLQVPQRKLCTLSSTLVAAALFGTALLVLVVVGGHGVDGKFGSLLGAYSKEDQVLPWYKLAAQLKGTAEAHGVKMESNEAKDRSLNDMMSAFDMTNSMDETAKSRIQEILGDALAKMKARIEALGENDPAARMPKLDAAGALKRLEQRRLKKERRLQVEYGAATPVGALGGAATDKISMAQCVLQANGALITIANAGFALSDIAKTCRTDSAEYDKTTCGATSAGLIGQISGLGSTIAALPSFCGAAENVPAICASDLMSFTSSIANIVGLGFNIKSDCTSEQNPINHELSARLNETVYHSGVWRVHGGQRSRIAKKIAAKVNALRAGGRRLPALPADPLVAALEEFHNQRDAVEDSQAIAQCYFAAYDLANQLPSLAMDIWTTSIDCKDDDTDDDKAVCAADTITIVTDFAGLITASAAIATTCPIEVPEHAGCVATSADVVNNALNFGAFGAVVKQDCRAPGTPGPDHFRVPLRR
mmetsp:Transcript_83503/g.147581  ORF Transcript_83503/g.147581 Transcript_83503/m.147581 type:complete len:499 (-) Transcript_83503:157-1653(-)